MAERFPWNRWLCPREKPILFDDGGYPEDPAGQYANILQPHCIPLHGILDARCGILLGEAGIGKSDAMQELEGVLHARGAAILKLDLGEYGDTGELSANLFDSPMFREWQNGGHQLHVVLDSLDEGIAGVKNIVGLLQRRVRQLPFDRLHLYISCRTTAWPETLTEHLIESFADERAVAVHQLVPLLRSDVVLAARAACLDADRFLAEVYDHDAQALACNPLTLRLLLNVFQSTGFPPSNLELLQRGLLALCETTQAQRDHGNAAPFTAAQLLAVASRVAALAILSGRAVVETAADVGAPRAGVPLADGLGGEEGDADARVAVDDAVMRAALRTGLFNARGADCFGFAHKTYGEFLTARFGTRNLLNVLRDQLEAEGVGVASTKTAPPLPIIIEPVKERLNYDIAIPITKPSLVHDIRKLSELNVSKLDAVYDQTDLAEPFRVRLKLEFATTNTEVHQADVGAGELPAAQELLAGITNKVIDRARLPNRFAELYPAIKVYVMSRCFGRAIDVDSDAVRSHLARLDLQEGIAKYLARKIAELIVERRSIEFDKADFRLSATLPFSWRRNLPPFAAKHTVFNYVATYNPFERSFAEFLDKAGDVLRFASLGTTEQGESGTQFRVDYLKPSGAVGFYHPDWVVVQKAKAGPVNWIIETKGRVWEGTTAKDDAINDWCERVSEATGTTWRYIRINQSEFVPAAKTLDELIGPGV